MASGTGGDIVAIFTALFAVAIIAIIVSTKANTASILNALGTATASSIGAAVSPVTGSKTGAA